MKAAAPSGDTLAAWLEAEGFAPIEGPGTIADVPLVRSLLIAAAKLGQAVSYSELLGLLGHRFNRPKMRALCRTLDAVDGRGAAAGEPGLAVLVVRESDGLPGQGWWVSSEARGYEGAFKGLEAEAFVRGLQRAVFSHWRDR